MEWVAEGSESPENVAGSGAPEPVPAVGAPSPGSAPPVGDPAGDQVGAPVGAPVAALDASDAERFERIARIAQRLFATDIAVVTLLDGDRSWFASRHGLDLTQAPRALSFCEKTFSDGDLFVVHDLSSDPRYADDPLVSAHPKFRFFAACPLFVGNGRRVGTLCLVDHHPRYLGAEDERLLRDLAATAEEELEGRQRAGLDELTGLANRNGLFAVGTHVLASAVRFDRPTALVYLDLDNLKVVNDRLGHAAGDELLKRLARTLTHTLRTTDVIARVGGDEFCVLASDTPHPSVPELLDRLRFAFNWEGRDREDPPIEVSMGAALFDPAHPVTLEELIATADAAMYADKRARRLQNA
ncbi:MAG TPA: sensor domain-containing diguanylate cyclase [Acidimicrobiia bacterium]|nr:sensor domain-containing diguanylate cyclase [Acidimicrobiia bacterium]